MSYFYFIFKFFDLDNLTIKLILTLTYTVFNNFFTLNFVIFNISIIFVFVTAKILFKVYFNILIYVGEFIYLLSKLKYLISTLIIL